MIDLGNETRRKQGTLPPQRSERVTGAQPAIDKGEAGRDHGDDDESGDGESDHGGSPFKA
jgi:hypothetical protein